MIHTVKGFGVVNKTEVDVFLELSCFFYDPKDVGNLISGSSIFSKSSSNIWKSLVHIWLEPRLEDFEHYFASVWDECNYAVVWTFLGVAFLWDSNENWSFPVLWPLLAYWVSTLITPSFSIWNSSVGIPSPPLALFVAMPPKARASPVAQQVKNPPAMQETWVRSLGWEDPLEKGKVTNSSILVWRIPWTV